MLMIRQIYERPFLLSLAIVIILFIVFFSVFVPVFYTSDDVGMMMLASGTGLGGLTPDEHLLFINVIIGFLLKRLYTTVPYFPWYGLFAFSTLFLSTVGLLYSILRRKCSHTRLIFFLLFFVTVELYFLVNTQFTFTSYLAGAAGVFLFLSVVEDDKCLPALLFALFLLILSALIRIEAFYMALLLGTPLISIKFIKNHNKKVVIRYAAFFIVLLLVTAAFSQYNNSSYKTEVGWSELPEVMNATAEFTDYSKARYSAETKRIFDEVGWSQNDFRMLLSSFRADEGVFSLVKMRKVLSNFPSRKTLGIKYILSFIKSQAIHKNAYVVFFAVLALFFSSYARKDKLYLSRVLATLGWMAVLVVYIIFYKYLKDRVYFSMISFLTFTTLFYSDKGLAFHWPEDRPIEKLKAVFLISFSILVLVVMGETVYRLQTFSRHTYDVNRRFKRDMASLNPSPKELFVVWTSSFPYQLVLPFDNLEYISNLRLIGSGMSPITANKMKEFGIRNFSVDLCNREDIFLITSNRIQRYIYKTYMKEHYGLNVFFMPDGRSGLSVFKVMCY